MAQHVAEDLSKTLFFAAPLSLALQIFAPDYYHVTNMAYNIAVKLPGSRQRETEAVCMLLLMHAFLFVMSHISMSMWLIGFHWFTTDGEGVYRSTIRTWCVPKVGGW